MYYGPSVWEASDIATAAPYELNRLITVWATVAYIEARDTLAAVEVHIPALPTTPTTAQLATAADQLRRLSASDYLRVQFPADIAQTAARGLANLAGAAFLLSWYADRPGNYWRQSSVETAIREGQQRIKAVSAYLGIEPEEAGVGDTLAELEQ